jgi:hypothetical protein
MGRSATRAFAQRRMAIADRHEHCKHLSMNNTAKPVRFLG